MPELYLLHPAAVHFPIALLSLGLATAAWAARRGEPSWIPEAASWLLWMGTASAWIAMGLGLLAEEKAPHVPSAWQTLNEHKKLAYWTVGLFTALSLWRLAMRRGWVPGTRRWALTFLAAWAAAAGVLISTAYHGGELVFTHGMGVRR